MFTSIRIPGVISGQLQLVDVLTALCDDAETSGRAERALAEAAADLDAALLDVRHSWPCRDRFDPYHWYSDLACFEPTALPEDFRP